MESEGAEHSRVGLGVIRMSEDGDGEGPGFRDCYAPWQIERNILWSRREGGPSKSDRATVVKLKAYCEKTTWYVQLQK